MADPITSSSRPNEVFQFGITQAEKMAVDLNRVADINALFEGLDMSIKTSGMELALARTVITRSVPGPMLDAMTARQLYDSIVLIAILAARGYYDLVKGIRREDNNAKQKFESVIWFVDSSGQKHLAVNTWIPAGLSSEEQNALLIVQKNSFARMDAELKERIVASQRGIYG